MFYRYLTDQVKKDLKTKMVFVAGARQVGKTTLAKTIIGKDITIEGDIRGNEHLVIDGSVKGNIEMAAHNFALGPDGRVEGEIHARNITISGRMKGNIKTPGKIEITKEADFRGDICAKSIAVENGAFFKGSVELINEPPQKAFSTEEPAASKAEA